MKLLIIVIAIWLSSCAQKSTETWTCSHPLISGGFPIELPTDSVLDSRGVLHVTAPSGEKVLLTGSSCIKVLK